MTAKTKTPRAMAVATRGERAQQREQKKYSTRPRVMQLCAWLSVIAGGAA